MSTAAPAPRKRWRTSRYEIWRTVVDLLRAGYRLTPRWVAGNNNGHLNDAALFNDELFLAVQRTHRPLTLLVARAVCPDNTAGMIRRH